MEFNVGQGHDADLIVDVKLKSFYWEDLPSTAAPTKQAKSHFVRDFRFLKKIEKLYSPPRVAQQVADFVREVHERRIPALMNR